MIYEGEYDDEELSELHLGRRQAKEIVRGPAQALYVLSIISLTLVIIGLVLDFCLGAIILGNANNPQGNPDKATALFIRFVWSVFLIISNSLTLTGASKMKELDSRSWSYVACITAILVPCSPCCILGFPFGIWGLMTLNNPKVSRYF